MEDFLDLITEGKVSNDEVVNDKFNKVLEYIPDIIGALTKNELIAPGAKVLEGKNPVVDEAKFVIEKVVAPTLKRLAGQVEKRIGGNVGKQLAEGMLKWGRSLETLPSKALSIIGPADIATSVLDLVLTSIDKATGNYRKINHQLDDKVLGIPVLGS